MNAEQFNLHVKERISKCLDTLGVKAQEYAHDYDRLRAFRAAGVLEHSSAEKALGGMLAKHIVSIYDMLNDPFHHSQAKWDEKIGDAINYLLLLDALLKEQGECPCEEN